MKTRNILALILIIISLICLYPGLVRPIFSLKVIGDLPIVGQVTFHNSTQSIMKSIQTLHKENNTLVAGLILLFSVIVPVLKASLLLVILLFQKIKGRLFIKKVVAVISKWSMADVFVVAIFLAFLAAKSNTTIAARLHEGFYYFLAYCLISILAAQLVTVGEEGY